MLIRLHAHERGVERFDTRMISQQVKEIPGGFPLISPNQLLQPSAAAIYMVRSLNTLDRTVETSPKPSQSFHGLLGRGMKKKKKEPCLYMSYVVHLRGGNNMSHPMMTGACIVENSILTHSVYVSTVLAVTLLILSFYHCQTCSFFVFSWVVLFQKRWAECPTHLQ